MAPTTRSKGLQTTPPNTKKGNEYTTTKKVRFFYAYDTREAAQSARSIARAQSIPWSTAATWLRQRLEFGSPVNHRTRPASISLGANPKLTEEQCRMLISPSKNPHRDRPYEAQIDYFNLNISKATVQRNLFKHTDKAQKYKVAYTQKKISLRNRQKRQQFGLKYCDKSI